MTYLLVRAAYGRGSASAQFDRIDDALAHARRRADETQVPHEIIEFSVTHQVALFHPTLPLFAEPVTQEARP